MHYLLHTTSQMADIRIPMGEEASANKRVKSAILALLRNELQEANQFNEYKLEVQQAMT